MDIAFRNALDGLRSNGARDLPSELEIEQSSNGTEWYGKKKDGDRWYLVKHAAESYNAEF